MSLSDLKEWNQNNSYQQLEENMVMPLPIQKTVSNQESGVQVLKEVTNRQSARSQSNLNYNSKNNSKQNESKPKVNNSQQNAKDNSKSTIPKTIVDRNNTLLIIEINTFRLLFKIYEKLKKSQPNEKELLNAIGNEVLRRVDAMTALVNPDKENIVSGSQVNDFGIAEA